MSNDHVNEHFWGILAAMKSPITQSTTMPEVKPEEEKVCEYCHNTGFEEIWYREDDTKKVPCTNCGVYNSNGFNWV